MFENNLHPDVAEDPEHLVVYGGRGKAARNLESKEGATVLQQVEGPNPRSSATPEIKQQGITRTTDLRISPDSESFFTTIAEWFRYALSAFLHHVGNVFGAAAMIAAMFYYVLFARWVFWEHLGPLQSTTSYEGKVICGTIMCFGVFVAVLPVAVPLPLRRFEHP